MRKYLARCVAAAVMAGMSLMGSGMATGQTAPQVLSDKVTVAGTITTGPGGFTFTSMSCTLTSDVEGSTTSIEGPFPCQQVTSILHRPDGPWVFNTVIVSPDDGLITWTSTLSGENDRASTIANMMAHISGPGTEYDNPEAGMAAPPGYAAAVKSSFTGTPTSSGTFSVTGTEMVSEASGAP